jgi:hypothetical protein
MNAGRRGKKGEKKGQGWSRATAVPIQSQSFGNESIEGVAMAVFHGRKKIDGDEAWEWKQEQSVSQKEG